MKAQAYINPEIIRIFTRLGIAVADLPLSETRDASADLALTQIGMRRTTAWVVTSWGREATVCFTNRHRKARHD